MRSKIKNIKFPRATIPLALIGVTILAFGPLISNLGFYQDDWHFIYYAYARGLNHLLTLTNSDGRPFAVWVYEIGFSWLGFAPIRWHIALLTVRCLTVLGIWGVFNQIWPEYPRQTFIAGMLFALYPFYTLQPLSVAYAPHWVTYFLLSGSLLAMILAYKNPKHFWLFTSIALMSEVTHLVTVEYFTGLELLRPIILWYLLGKKRWRDKFLEIFKRWLPYLIPFLLFVVWRGFLYHGPAEARNMPAKVVNLLYHPFETIIATIKLSLPDFVLILFSSWYSILKPTVVDFFVPANRLIFPYIVIVFGIAAFYFFRIDYHESTRDSSQGWNKQAFTLGAAAFIFGLITTYAAGLIIHLKVSPWNSRFGLGAQLGASLIITAIFESMITSPKVRNIVLAILIGLLIGWHIRNTNDYRWAWQEELDFYQQLNLRAPDILPNSTIVAEKELLSFMGDYPTTFAINTTYLPPNTHPQETINYWFLPIATDLNGRAETLTDGTLLNYSRYGIKFNGKSQNSLVIAYNIIPGQCLWILRPEDAAWRILPLSLQEASKVSNLGLIKRTPPDKLFLRSIERNQSVNWCNYFEQADLARQFKDWKMVISYWEGAKANNLRPSNGFEYIPFIEAYANLKDWKTAANLTRQSNKISRNMNDLLCPAWIALNSTAPSSPGKNDAVAETIEYLQCAK